MVSAPAGGLEKDEFLMIPFGVFKPNTKNDAIHHNLNMVGAWFHDEGL